MCIDNDEIPDCRARVLARKRFVYNLAIMVVWGSFSVGVYKHATPGSISDCIVLLKFACGASYERQSIIEAIADAV